MAQPVQTPEHSKYLFQLKWPKCPWSTLSWPKVKQGENTLKISLFIVLHQTRASRRFLATLTKFDPELTLGGPPKPLFWFDHQNRLNPMPLWRLSNSHSNDYSWVEIGVKTVEISRKPVNALIDAPLTSWSHNFWSDCWIFEFHTFLEIGSQDISGGVKINPIWGASQAAALQGVPPCKACWGYKSSQAPPDQKRKKKKKNSTLS